MILYNIQCWLLPYIMPICQNSLRLQKGVLKHYKKYSLQKI